MVLNRMSWAAVFVIAALPYAVLAQDSAEPAPTAPGDATGILDQVQAQMPEEPAPSGLFNAIAVLNQDGLLAGSLYGQRIQRELEAARLALAAENRQIEAQLTAEELGLTELRPTMDPAEFRLLAVEFDERVEAIRSAQIAKDRSLQTQVEAAQARFFELAFPVLLDIVQRRGASVLMDSRSVLLSAEGIDITQEAVSRVNDEIGEGGPDPLVQIDGRRLDTAPLPRPSTP